ncbi:hypothetical protein NPIL_597401 [Nephila pilipes]|uniref:Uncharacterized protein n=1 Tax=Nephila pilipes TaxID=299642 RepID=A0A8X6Q5E1_NEPPI|nr:hypothetical protein NPIL_597401 [Nephila pilipes]
MVQYTLSDMPYHYGVVKIFKYFTFKPELSFPSETELLISIEQLATNNGNNSTSFVSSIMIYRICQALDLSVELASSENTRDFIQTPPRNVRNVTPLPAVYSFTVFKICQALDLKAELRAETERPTSVIKKKMFIPVVRSRSVFSICQALELDVLLAEF